MSLRYYDPVSETMAKYRGSSIGQYRQLQAAGESYKLAVKPFKEAMAYYEPGGGFGAGVEAALKRSGTQAVSGGMQNLISAGLGGTTQAGGLQKKFEEEVGMPARANVEGARAQALSELKMMMSQMLENRRSGAMQINAQSNLANLQAKTQADIANQQTKLGYAELGAKSAASQQEMALQQALARMRQPSGGMSASVGGGNGIHAGSGMNISPGPAPYGGGAANQNPYGAVSQQPQSFYGAAYTGGGEWGPPAPSGYTSGDLTGPWPSYAPPKPPGGYGNYGRSTGGSSYGIPAGAW